MQNFLVNGSISKEFIQSNKKELQKFIKSFTRSGSQNGFFKGYNEAYDTSKHLPAVENNRSLNDSTNADTEGKRGMSMDLETVNRKNSKLFA